MTQRRPEENASERRGRNTAVETEPLLPPQEHDESNSAEIEEETRKHVVFVSFGLMVIADFAGFLMDVPQTSILETVICHRHYASHSYTAGDCSIAPVQAELAILTQLLNTSNLLAGFLVAIPFGLLADRWGRRPILVMSMLGMLVQNIVATIILWRADIFPPRLIWLFSTFRLFGGGDVVATSMLFLVVADVTPAAKRANLFFTLSACILIGDIVATPLSALLMARSPWVPYIASTVLLGLGIVIPILLLPETLIQVNNVHEQSQPAARDTTEQHGQKSTLWDFRYPHKLRVLANANIVAICSAFLVAALGRQSTSFLVQYVRQRFGLTYSKASLLIALRGCFHLALLVVFLPVLSRHLGQRGLSVAAKDLFISRASVGLLAAGSVLVALAPTVGLVALGIVVLALGSGFGPAARSLATALVHPDEAGTLYSTLGLMQSIGG
ncbi:major facilitator superfamily domain, general substrate transporter [Colletotrichum tofieldiae]|nr:major facilitator superfamily domain, general substrate transporter [Colletotrichum tofieldiae]